MSYTLCFLVLNIYQPFEAVLWSLIFYKSSPSGFESSNHGVGSDPLQLITEWALTLRKIFTEWALYLGIYYLGLAREARPEKILDYLRKYYLPYSILIKDNKSQIFWLEHLNPTEV